MNRRLLLTLVALLLLGINSVWAQTRLVTGRVVDETGAGYPGAAITVKGTQVGTVTDVDGNFRLNVPEGSNTLTIQAISYASQDVAITGDNVTVRLALAAKELQGAVVTALAIKREKRELGYSATTLSSDDLNSANQTSALSAIQGKTAGVNITSNTGAPGGSTRVVLRGEKSASGSNNALIVVDGIIINNSSRLQDPLSSLEQVDFGNRGNDINPEDIESISVLKGPAAAALYGSLGANGAIMITTKSGRARRGPGKAEISFQSNYTLQDVLKVPEQQSKFGQGNTNDIPDDRRENFSWGLPLDGKLRPWGQVIDGKQQVKPYSAQTDNLRDFFDIGRTWENSLAIAGSTEKNSYYLSLNTLNNKGIIPSNFYDKYSVRFNGSAELTNKFYSNVNVNYVNVTNRTDAMGQADGAVWSNVLSHPVDIPIRDLRNYDNPYYSMEYTDADGVNRYGYYGAYSKNPYWLSKFYDNRTRTDRVLGGLTLGFRSGNWDIFNRVGADVVADKTYIRVPKHNSLPFDEAFYVAPDGLQTQFNNGGYTESAANSILFNNDLIANYSKPLSEDVTFNGLVGGNIRLSRINNVAASIDPKSNALVIPGFYNLSNGNGPVVTANATFEERIVALYSSLRLDYKKILFLEVTGRNDWNSTLLPSKPSFFYPSANASFVLSDLWRDNDFASIMNYTKIRGGYASVGNGTAAYQNNDPGYIKAVSDYGFGTFNFPFGNVPGFTKQGPLGNPDLRPERTNSWEFGVEASFFRDRIVTEATYYQSMSIDQIIRVPLPSSTGYTSRLVNVGDISNKGIELSLRVIPISQRNGLRWELFGTYYKNTNRVERLADGVSQITLGGFSGLSITASAGQPFGAFYAVDLAKDPQGRVIVDSATGLPSPGADQVYKGSYQPKFIASWGTNLKYKSLTLNVLFDTKQGGIFYSHTKRNMAFIGTSPETVINDREEYVFPNSVYQNSNGDYVVNTTQKFLPYEYYIATYQNTPSLSIVDASYVKLREASLYYTLPERWLKRTAIGNASIGIYGTNLAIWTAEDNTFVDPEVNSGGASNEQGFDYISRPSVRSYGMSLRITF